MQNKHMNVRRYYGIKNVHLKPQPAVDFSWQVAIHNIDFKNIQEHLTQNSAANALSI